ncbi:DUF3088 domain-containing protein [Henriciella litoralis]|uniref:DUF3088 domain-containing protein n=1 Tax=Henriciella litoralis TaxID=568102 RepID=UPI000A00230A|nr:DUF3088 domain-containing protein [Henriciella litoralis]
MADTLYLLLPGEDPDMPGEIYFCPPCAMVEGVLASAPQHGKNLQVERIQWPRPRTKIVELIGEENQSLPMLLLAEGETSPHQTGTVNGRAFINDRDAILEALAERHGFPRPHP